MSTTNSHIPGSSAKAAGTDIPIGHLDYNYVKDCTNVTELEEIITILRSGKEGYYPELVEFTEKKLQEIHPKSDVLRIDKPAPSMKDLDADEQKSVTEDLMEWMNEANDMDKKLKENNNGKHEVNSVDGLPPVRSKKTIVDDSKKEKTGETINSDSKKSVKPRDWKKWDKFDINKELEGVDKNEEKTRATVHESKKTVELEPVLNKDLSEEERLLRATREKEKGNEAFRAQDYKEAVVYYTNSLTFAPTAASYNNRAAAELKIDKYHEAIEDCNKVLELEASNIKAFLRRGMAYKALKQYDQAVADFNSMLKIEPNNKRAKDLLAEVESSKSEKIVSEEKIEKPSGRRNETENKVNAGAKTKKKGQRLKIVEVENSDSLENGKCSENGLKGQVEDKNLEGSKGIIEDLEVVNSGKHEQEGIAMDKLVNGHTTDHKFKDSPGIDGVDRSLATESEAELKEPGTENDMKHSLASENLQKVEAAPSIQETVLEIPEKVKSLMKEGNDFYKMGHYSEALERFSKSVDILWPDRSSYTSAVSGLINNKAACFFKMGQCKQCVAECNESLKLIENNLKALLRRGTAYETMEKYAEAFRDFNRVRLIDGSNRVAQEHCSRVIKHLEMLHGKSWRKKIFEMDGDDQGKQQIFPNVDKSSKPGNQVEVSNSSQEKKNIFPEKTNLQPENSQSAGKKETEDGVVKTKVENGADVKARFLKLKESGNSLVKKGKHEEAIKYYTDCIKLCPEEVAVYTNRSLCYLQLNKYDLAENDCNAALKIQEGNIKALFRRGKARKGLGRYREASEDFVQVLKLDSKNSAAQSELTNVLGFLKKERKDSEKSAPKRKKIVIQDVEGVEDKPPSKPTQKQANTSPTKKKETSKVIPNDTKPNAPSSESAKKESTRENPSAKVNEKETSKPKEESGAKDAKPSNQTPIKYNLKSAYQFLQAWKSVKKNDTAEDLNILKQVTLADLPKVISNKLDADMIKRIIEALNLEIVSNGDAKFVYQFLQKLILVERFEMTMMFLSSQEKEVLKSIFENITQQNIGINREDLSKLRKKYNA